MKGIKGILIDSGKVLNEPVRGHWFITPNFFDFIDESAFESISENKRSEAFSKAGQYMEKQKLILTQEEEYKHFLEFYRIFSENLPELNLEHEDIVLITKDLVFNDEKYRFFEEVKEIIPYLSKKYKLAVVSDAWPTLENVFIKANMRKYFSSFIISSKLGITKPNEIMYSTALRELNIKPEETIFIDDNIGNCHGAKALGIESFLLCRDEEEYEYNRLICKEHKVIKDIKSILEFIE